MNISSIIVKTSPKYTESLIKMLKKIENVDYHFHDENGRIIVTIEADDVSGEIAILRKIENLDHVISADMSYAYAEDELEKEKEKIGKSDKIIFDKLDDDNEVIEYSGSVYSLLGKNPKKQ